jgi:hypothetical protein
VILTIAVIGGLTGGLIHAYVKKRQLIIPQIGAGWLILAAFIPQLLCFFLPVTRTRIPHNMVAAILIISQLMLVVFAWLNRKQFGFWALGVGVALNALVILANGGWMPISPETLLRLNPAADPQTWMIGQRLGVSKDIILSFDSMIFPLLSDRIVLPPFIPSRLAYSLGDIFIACGAGLFLWSVGSTPHSNEDEVYA